MAALCSFQRCLVYMVEFSLQMEANSVNPSGRSCCGAQVSSWQELSRDIPEPKDLKDHQPRLCSTSQALLGFLPPTFRLYFHMKEGGIREETLSVSYQCLKGECQEDGAVSAMVMNNRTRGNSRNGCTGSST